MDLCLAIADGTDAAAAVVARSRADFHGWPPCCSLHGFAAATQDVAIDALCIATTTPAERGGYNGWMQVGMLLGRATMGGGVLALYDVLGQAGAVSLLVATILFSMVLLLATTLPMAQQVH